MKKILKNSSLFFIIILSVLMFLPCNVNAQSQEINYTKIDENPTIELDNDFKIESISFKNNSSNSSLSFGITIAIDNSSDYNYSLTSNVYYYDKSYNLLATSNSNQEVLADKYVNIIQMSSINDIQTGYTADDIYYYKILFDYNKSEGNSNYPTSSNTPSLNHLYDSYDYVIDSYDVNINVNENNTFDITETITANFNVARHGIFRKIPLTNTVRRLDGKITSNRASITNLTINEEYTSARENGYYKIQIGNANKTLTGKKEYVISYNYNIGKDPIKNYDELYLNIIGTEWDTAIGNITFTITMPKAFDVSKIGFSSGKAGSVDNSKVKYTVSDNVITGSYDGILQKGEGLTIRTELEEGYFTGAGYNTDFLTYLLFLIPIIGLIISFILWLKYGKDDQVIETVEFYPPNGFNSLDIGFLYKGKADEEDVVSLLVYLANKGYIKIVETPNKSLFFRNNFKIVKLKEYDGDDKNEQLFLEGLFESKSKLKDLSSFIAGSTTSLPVTDSENIEVTNSDLYDSFYMTMSKILKGVNKKTNKKKIFESNTSSKRIVIILLIILALVTIVSIPTLEYGGFYELGISLFIILYFKIKNI